MAGLNKVMIIGNLGADPEMRYMADGKALTSFRVASSRNYNGPDGERREETEWFSVVTWQKLAEQCTSFCRRGAECTSRGVCKRAPGTDRTDSASTEQKSSRRTCCSWTAPARCHWATNTSLRRRCQRSSRKTFRLSRTIHGN